MRVRVRVRVGVRARARARVRVGCPGCDLLAVEAPLELDDLVLDRPGLQLVHEDLRIDPDGESIYRRRASRRVAVYALVALRDAFRAAGTEHARARGVEVSREVGDVEAAPAQWCVGVSGA